jgi:tRNA pseudouridine55 synthase
MGLLVVNKPSGVTSRAAVDRIAAALPRVRLGHAGTLDPLASGVLVVCIGPATRLVPEIHGMQKAYRTVVRLGARSDTCDAMGRIDEEANPRFPSTAEIESALPSFVGVLEQIPPQYSAVKIEGRRAYELARAGARPRLTAKRVRIDRVSLLSYQRPRIEVEIECGGGTYIRAIARDLGELLGCGAYVEALERTRIGPFGLDQAVDLSTLTASSIHLHARPALDALTDLPRIVLEPEQLANVACGRRVELTQSGQKPGFSDRVALLDHEGQLVALAERNNQEGWAQPRKVFL